MQLNQTISSSFRHRLFSFALNMNGRGTRSGSHSEATMTLAAFATERPAAKLAGESCEMTMFPDAFIEDSSWPAVCLSHRKLWFEVCSDRRRTPILDLGDGKLRNATRLAPRQAIQVAANN